MLIHAHVNYTFPPHLTSSRTHPNIFNTASISTDPIMVRVPSWTQSIQTSNPEA
jgi:hypothetical protein